jgi:anti-sigma factor RsiW
MSDECFRWRTALHEWLDGTADAELAALVRAHWRTCPDCQRLAAEWQTVAELLAEMLPTPAPSAFERRWRQRRQAIAASSVSWHGIAAAWAMTLIGLISLTVWFGWSLAGVMRNLSHWWRLAEGVPTLPAELFRNLWNWLTRWV